MIERVLFITWGLWLLLILIAAFRVLGFLIAKRRQDKRWGDGSVNQQSVAVIVPVKGFDYQSTPRFFDTLFAQDYSNYRVIVCFESWSDPVAVWLKDEFEVTEDHPFWIHPVEDAGLKSVTLACAGQAQSEGQKVHNQRAAFTHLDENDHLVAFADADISFKQDWLTKLVAPINQRTHPLSTTYRWLVPKRPTLPNQVASVINGSITTQGGSELTNVLWGGSMAMAKSVFDKIDVPALLEGSVNDDLRISKAARKAGNRIAFVRSLVLPTMIDFNWRALFEFAKRQYTQVKIFSPILYTGTNLVIGFYALGLLSVIAALVYGYFYAWIPIAAAYVIDQFRALMRQQIYLSLFPEDGIRRKLFSAGWLEHMLTPCWMLLHWLILISTWTQSKISWGGVQYRILSRSKTRILGREVVTERLPVGVPGLALISSLHDRRRGTYTQPVSPIETQPFRPAESAAVAKEQSSVEVGEPGAPAPAPEQPVSHPGTTPLVTPLSSADFALARYRKRKAALRQKRRPPGRKRRRLPRALPHVLYIPAAIANPGESAPPGSALTLKPGPAPGDSAEPRGSSPAPGEPFILPETNPGVTPLSSGDFALARHRKRKAALRQDRKPPGRKRQRLPRAQPHALYSPAAIANPGESAPPGSALSREGFSPAANTSREADSRARETSRTKPGNRSIGPSADFTQSHAAHRPSRLAGTRAEAASGKTPARSGRPNQQSGAVRGARLFRPVTTRPSGRPG